MQTKLSLNKYKGCSSKAAARINYNKIIGYKFKNNYNNKFKKNPACFLGAAANTTYFNSAETYKLLYVFFKSMYCLISKPVFKYTNDKVIIQLFYYLNIPRKKIFRLFSIFYINSIKKSNILVNILALNLKNKRKKASILLQKILSKNPVKDLNDPNLISANSIPAFLSGLNIKISGRLMGESIIPRRTKKVFGKGASATGKVNYLDAARITKKNRKGAYTIKITSGQNLF